MTEEKKIHSGDILKECAQLRPEYNFLVFITAIDYPDKDIIEIIYYLRNLKDQKEIKLRAEIPRKTPEIDSISGIWPAAEWHEREVFDMFGVHFKGNPDLRRILLPEDWEGHPLLKDYTRHGVIKRPETIK